MHLHRPLTSLSRRSVVAVLVGGLGLSLPSMVSQAAAQVATPHVATPASSGVSWLGHPIVGIWQWVSNPVHESTAIVADDGAYLEYDPLLGAGIGLWRPTAERSAEAVVTFRQVDREWGAFSPDTVPEAPAFRSDLVFDRVVLRMRMEVDADGSALTATGSITAIDAEGDILYTLDRYTGNAKRLEADP